MSEAIEKFLSEHKSVPCTCGMDDNMHETTCAKYEWALAWYEVRQLRARAAEADMLRYAATARIETLTTTLPGDVLARGEVVTVTVFEKEGERK